MIAFILAFLVMISAQGLTPVRAEETTDGNRPRMDFERGLHPDFEIENRTYPSVHLDYFVDAVGTYFEIINSTYLDITLTSTETVHVYLESIPKMISLVIENNGSATSTTLTFSGFEPNTLYYRYQDGNLMANFTTDGSEEYTYTQDISQIHHVLIQEEKLTIYIKPDGTVEPLTAPISIIDNVYTFTDNIYEPIVVQADNIVIDGNGYTLQGPGRGIGFNWYGRTNVTIRNVTIRGWGHGIHFWYPSGNTISGTNITANNQCGIDIWYSSGNSISGNNITGNGIYGIGLHESSGNTISGNNIIGSGWEGITLYVSSNYNSISGNNITANNYHGIGIYRSSDNSISGNNITANNQMGIDIWYSSSNSISGNNIIGSGWDGIHLGDTSCNTIADNLLSGNGWDGIWAKPYCDHNLISDNYVFENGWGIWIESSHNLILNNDVSNNTQNGVLLWHIWELPYTMTNNTLRNNSMTCNGYNFGIRGDNVSDFIHDIDTSNTVEGKPIYYLINQKNLVVDPSTFPDVGYLGLYNSTNIVVKNLNLTKNARGVQFAFVTDSSIENVTVPNNDCGIYLIRSYNNTMTDNVVTENKIGFYLEFSENNTIEGNKISDNEEGFYLIDNVNANVIKCNEITNNTCGLWIGAYEWSCYNNTVTGNTIMNNDYGIEITDSSGNLVYHNNFIDNEVQAYDDNPVDNNWHHPDLLEGNYWSDYPGVDDGSGRDKHAIAGDGIGDTDVPWPERNYDNYPFIHESGWIDTTPPVTELTIGTHYVDDAGNIYVTSATEFTLTATDLASGVAHTYYRVNYGNWIEYVGAFTLVGSEGSYTIDYYSVDTAGNQEAIRSASVILTTLRIKVDSYLTDSNFNSITYFDVVFAKDKTAGYRLVATNPGQFYYNIEVTNNWTVTIPSLIFEANIPIDFVLKGAVPIHVYLDDIDITETVQISGTLITVTDVPVGSKIYVTIHIDYALKGSTYASLDDFELKGYIFDAAALSSKSSATLIAHTKKVTAIAGFVTDANGNPIQDAIVKLFDSQGNVIATTVTDENGFYYFIDMPAGDYTVQVTYNEETYTHTTTAVSKELTQVDFQIE